MHSTQKPPADDLPTLLAQRREALKARVEIIEHFVSNARSTQEELLSAREDLFNAEIEMAITTGERVEALQRKLENAKELESLMQQRKQSARGTEAEVFARKG